MKSWFSNPVLISELKVRARSVKMALTVMAYIGIMLAIAFLFFKTAIEPQMMYNRPFNTNQYIGLQLYIMLAVVQFILILIIIPAQTSGAISSEREKQTLDLLLCTRISPAAIVLGKMMASMSTILLLIISSIPLFSLAFLFGGVAPSDLVVLFLFYLITAFAVGSIGIFCSALFKRTVTATVTAYICIFALGVLTVLLGIYMMNSYYKQVPAPTHIYVPWVFYLNPALGLADILSRQSGDTSISLNAILASFAPGGNSNAAANAGMWSFWIKNSIAILSVAAVLLSLSAWFIKPVKRLALLKKKDRLL